MRGRDVQPVSVPLWSQDAGGGLVSKRAAQFSRPIGKGNVECLVCYRRCTLALGAGGKGSGTRLASRTSAANGRRTRVALCCPSDPVPTLHDGAAVQWYTSVARPRSLQQVGQCRRLTGAVLVKVYSQLVRGRCLAMCVVVASSCCSATAFEQDCYAASIGRSASRWKRV